MSVTTTFVGGAVTLHVTHLQATGIPEDGEGALLVGPDDGMWDRLTRVEVDRSGLSRRIYVRWHSSPTCQSFELLLVEETATLFIGAGTLSASLDLEGARIVSRQAPAPFWGFERKGCCVLELGERGCALYDLEGRLLGRATVDPPYSVYETTEGIRVASPCAGTRWLRYPA